jgi:hypothetical protein
MPPTALVSRGNVRLAGGVAFDVDTSSAADCVATSGGGVTLAPGAAVTSPVSVPTSLSPRAADSSTYLLTSAQIAQLAGGFGMIRVTGDTTIAGGSLEGILIVEGALTITGPFVVSGLVVARGPIVAVAGGLSVTGAMLSFATTTGSQLAIDAGPAVFRYSRCAVALALRRAVPLRPVRERSWAELF